MTNLAHGNLVLFKVFALDLGIKPGSDVDRRQNSLIHRAAMEETIIFISLNSLASGCRSYSYCEQT